MKLLLCLSIFAVAASEAGVMGYHTKRFAGVNIAGISGATGCVVVDDKLFANGLYIRDLNAEEQKELEKYVEETQKYKEEMKTLMEEKRKAWEIAHQSAKGSRIFASLADKNPPKPKKPSFCNTANITQYYFDGCMVQNNKVYVGRTYVRDLKPEEIEQLKKFDEKMTNYQKQISSTIHQEISDIFGGKLDILSLFTGRNSEDSTPEMNDEIMTANASEGAEAAAIAAATAAEGAAATTAAATTTATVTNETPFEAPETPNFCIAIY